MDTLTDHDLSVIVTALNAHAKTVQFQPAMLASVLDTKAKLIAEMGNRCAAEYVKQHGKPQDDQDAQPFGISPSKEAYVKLPTGYFFVFPSTASNANGADYVRVVNDRGGEIVYWNSDEWAEEPENVMGAICGAMLNDDPDGPSGPNYYQFAPDCKFPEGQDFEPCN